MASDDYQEAFKIREDALRVFGGLETGIWFVEKTKDGNYYHFLCKKQEELPEAINLATFDRLRTKIAKEVFKFLKKAEKEFLAVPTSPNFPKTKDIIDIVRDVVKKG